MFNFETIALDEYNNIIVILDQTRLPGEEKYITLTSLEDVYHAIKDLQVRGAPLIGITAAMGIFMHMAAVAARFESSDALYTEFRRASDYLNASRPTAVNLSWALSCMDAVFIKNLHLSPMDVCDALKAEAKKILADDIKTCKSIGVHGSALLKPNMGVLTHCNAGALAAHSYGTALAPIYVAHEQGMPLRVFADETRPVLQGARLTAFELVSAGVDTTLICDNMAAMVMNKGLIDIIFVGCDRVAANGDAANKIGTYNVALLAKHFNIPFYVCAPFSTIDLNTKTGDDIAIEERGGDEITELHYTTRLAPKGVKTFNPSFDVTPNALITGFITEKGILKPPFTC